MHFEITKMHERQKMHAKRRPLHSQKPVKEGTVSMFIFLLCERRNRPRVYSSSLKSSSALLILFSSDFASQYVAAHVNPYMTTIITAITR